MITTQLIQSIGWTLIHSLWQGLAIFIVLKVAVRLTNRSELKYAMGVGAMVLTVVASVITFATLNESQSSNGFQYLLAATTTSTTNVESTSFIQTALQFINQNIIWLIRFWILGFAVGLVRIAAGLWYIKRLRSNANPVGDEWTHLVNRLCDSLNVSRVVTMAEAGISSPMVVGFVKPMILFPAGLLSGLSVEQVETILVHELSHIRRQDYIINLVQSVIETLYFFNPFVLLMSSLIRDERENCCDDMVIAKGISPISYVKTLAQLEASRSSSKLALGFAGNQNQLLNRIKRIMENSAKNDWGKSRFVPVAVLALGLICASWLSIGTEAKAQVKQKEKEKNETVVSTYNLHHSDTSREDGLIMIRRSRGAVPDMDFVPEVPMIGFVPEVVEVPEIPMIDFMPEMIEMPEIPGMPEIGFDFGFDTIPGIYFREPADFDQFEKEMRAKMKVQFGDFYSKNQKELNKMFDEMKQNEQVRRREAAEVVDIAQMERSRAIEAEMFANEARIAAEMHKQQFEVLGEQMREQRLILEDMAARSNEYNQELLRELANDGYIEKGKKVNNINVNDDSSGNLIINGIKIKKKDEMKYRAMHDKYFERFNKRSTSTGKSE